MLKYISIKILINKIAWKILMNFKCIYLGEGLVWFGFLRINVDLAIFQPYLDLEAGDNQSLKIQVARPGIEPRSSCSASQELNHSATAAPLGEGRDALMHVYVWEHIVSIYYRPLNRTW